MERSKQREPKRPTNARTGLGAGRKPEPKLRAAEVLHDDRQAGASPSGDVVRPEWSGARYVQFAIVALIMLVVVHFVTTFVRQPAPIKPVSDYDNYDQMTDEQLDKALRDKLRALYGE